MRYDHIGVVRRQRVNVVKTSVRYGRLYPTSQEIFLVLNSKKKAESNPEPQCSRKEYVNEKFPMTISGNEPATFRLVVQCLNQQRHRVSPNQIQQKGK